MAGRWVLGGVAIGSGKQAWVLSMVATPAGPRPPRPVPACRLRPPRQVAKRLGLPMIGVNIPGCGTPPPPVPAARLLPCLPSRGAASSSPSPASCSFPSPRPPPLSSPLSIHIPAATSSSPPPPPTSSSWSTPLTAGRSPSCRRAGLPCCCCGLLVWQDLRAGMAALQGLLKKGVQQADDAPPPTNQRHSPCTPGRTPRARCPASTSSPSSSTQASSPPSRWAAGAGSKHAEEQATFGRTAGSSTAAAALILTTALTHTPPAALYAAPAPAAGTAARLPGAHAQQPQAGERDFFRTL